MTVRLEIRERVAWLTLDRPAKRNALTGAMWAELAAHLDGLDSPDVVAAVLRGAGGAFSAGADLTELRIPDPEVVGGIQLLAEQTVLRLRDLRLLTIAFVDGACLGAGCSLALACDLRICTPAARFGVPALRHGLVYEPVHVRRLVQVVGPGPAALLLYGGEVWNAEEALAHGLVDRCRENAVEEILAVLRGTATGVVGATAAAIRTGT